MNIKELLGEMVKRDASDLFYRAGGIPRLRVDGRVVPLGGSILTVEDVRKAVEDLTKPEQREKFKDSLDIDFALFLEEFRRRFRISIFMQRNWPSIVVRNIRDSIANFEQLNLPVEVMQRLAMETRGLVLLTGTIASVIEYINQNCQKHILTIEEPIEFTFKDKKALINQRDLGLDVISYGTALRAFTLQSPDVIYIGNIRDHETMSAALTAAETGVLVLSTLHTVNAPLTIERIINFFPPHQHQQIRIQLSSLLKGVMSLRLLPLKDSTGRIPAYEVMILTPTISRLIREGKSWELPKFIEDGGVFGMQSFNQSLAKLVNEGKVNEEDAIISSDNREEFTLGLKGFRKR
jgi:twitching motility protein PilT